MVTFTNSVCYYVDVEDCNGFIVAPRYLKIHIQQISDKLICLVIKIPQHYNSDSIAPENCTCQQIDAVFRSIATY